MYRNNEVKLQGYFCITIDTEEEGRWGRGFPREGHSVEHIKELPRLQALFDKYGIKPVYLVDYPVVKNSLSLGILKDISDDGRCEIGAHVHPWCNPPLEEDNDKYHSYLSNLPLQLQKEKIRILSDEIEKSFGKRPLSFRAGRYGFNGKTVEALESQGYLVDSSVTPYKSWEHDGGPSFIGAPVSPYFPATADVNKSEGERMLLELPVSVGFNRANFDIAYKVHEYLSAKPFSSFHIIGIMDRLKILRKVFLTPELFSFEEMKMLTKIFVYKKIPLLVMMFHSTIISPGKTPYLRNGNELEQFYLKLDNYFDFAINDIKLRNCTLIEFRNQYIGGKN
jgi:hypothetical protein